MNVRLFFAVDIRCTAALRKIVIALGGLGRAVKAVDPDQLHVTMKFLGSTPADRVLELSAALTEARLVDAFDVALIGLGAFPNERRPSVIWAGLDPLDSLRAVATELESRISPLGFPTESRPFQPHVTLARIRFRPPPIVAELLRDEAGTDFGTVRIDSVVLYRSDTTTHGPKYVPLARAALSVRG